MEPDHYQAQDSDSDIYIVRVHADSYNIIVIEIERIDVRVDLEG